MVRSGKISFAEEYMMNRNVKNYVLHVTLFLVFISSSLFVGNVIAATCDLERDLAEFVFEERHPDTTLDHSKNSEEIKQLSSGGQEAFRNQVAANPKYDLSSVETPGLTTFQTRGNFRAIFQVKNMEDGTFCVYVNKLIVSYGFEKILIYVSNQREVGSCKYNAVLDHENEHVRISKNAMRRVIPSFRLLAAYVDAMPIVRNSNKAQLQQKFLDDIRVRFGEMIAEFKKVLVVENGKIDTFEEYIRLSALCQGGTAVPAVMVIEPQTQQP